jgi:hypothetical protein
MMTIVRWQRCPCMEMHACGDEGISDARVRSCPCSAGPMEACSRVIYTDKHPSWANCLSVLDDLCAFVVLIQFEYLCRQASKALRYAPFSISLDHTSCLLLLHLSSPCWRLATWKVRICLWYRSKNQGFAARETAVLGLLGWLTRMIRRCVISKTFFQ